MTRKLYFKLTEKEKRIRVAELCGWNRLCWFHHLLKGCTNLQPSAFIHIVPNYLNDLNAMHKAEDTMSDDNMLRC